jgi:hypothetical protein
MQSLTLARRTGSARVNKELRKLAAVLVTQWSALPAAVAFHEALRDTP